VRRNYAGFSYQAGSWTKPRRVVVKLAWHRGELCPRVGFIVTNPACPADQVVAFHNQRGTTEQQIKPRLRHTPSGLRLLRRGVLYQRP
jgi:hypothetical protein